MAVAAVRVPFLQKSLCGCSGSANLAAPEAQKVAKTDLRIREKSQKISLTRSCRNGRALLFAYGVLQGLTTWELLAFTPLAPKVQRVARSRQTL